MLRILHLPSRPGLPATGPLNLGSEPRFTPDVSDFPTIFVNTISTFTFLQHLSLDEPITPNLIAALPLSITSLEYLSPTTDERADDLLAAIIARKDSLPLLKSVKMYSRALVLDHPDTSDNEKFDAWRMLDKARSRRARRVGIHFSVPWDRTSI